jgi:hypothetical protein
MKRIKLKGGDEVDVFSRFRHVLRYLHRPGIKKSIRKQYNKRFRKLGKQDIQY